MMHGRQLSFGKSIAEDWQANLSLTLSGQRPGGEAGRLLKILCR
jgi:hypothetical protein